MSDVATIMREALATYIERSTSMGNTWYPVGEITRVLYPEGIVLKTKEDFAKFHILQWIIGKLVRFINSNGIDSIHDAGVYCFIMESIVKDEASNNLSES
jgi:hypothetical protein